MVNVDQRLRAIREGKDEFESYTMALFGHSDICSGNNKTAWLGEWRVHFAHRTIAARYYEATDVKVRYDEWSEDLEAGRRHRCQHQESKLVDVLVSVDVDWSWVLCSESFETSVPIFV